MNPVSSISLSGMNAATTRLGAAAHNVANLQTADFRRQGVVQQAQADGGVSTRLTQAREAGNAMANDTVDMLSATHAFTANLRVFQAQDRMTGALLDVFA